MLPLNKEIGRKFNVRYSMRVQIKLTLFYGRKSKQATFENKTWRNGIRKKVRVEKGLNKGKLKYL